MKSALKFCGMIFLSLMAYSCGYNLPVETKAVPVKHYPPRDYFEIVFWNDVGYVIPETHLPYTEKIGTMRILNHGNKGTLIIQAQQECRKMGGNWIILDNYWYNSLGPSMLEATAYKLDWGKDKCFQGQLLMGGFTEQNLREEWKRRGVNPYEGIYQAITSDNGYIFKVGIWNDAPSDQYYINYLSGMSGVRSWKEGDIIGIVESTAMQGVFLGDWVKLDKYSTPVELVFTSSGSFTVSYTPWNQREKQNFTYIKTFPKDVVDPEIGFSSSTSTGFLLSPKGYIVTCHHVVKNAKKIYVIDNNKSKTRLLATVSVFDANNDLSIIKVNGLSSGYGGSLPYGFDDTTHKTGESVFCMGYPLTQIMGNEIKVTSGILSSVTGYQGDVSSYQISAPVQPGNSGGPLFNSSGNVIGVINAKISQAENVSYAVKVSYLNQLIDLISDDIRISKVTQSSSTLPAMVERFKPAVYIIEVEY
jgi:V8-like Glu-specific endopeptidase